MIYLFFCQTISNRKKKQRIPEHTPNRSAFLDSAPASVEIRVLKKDSAPATVEIGVLGKDPDPSF